VMYIEGGVYADVDVEALQPLDAFIPPQFEEKDIDLVIGVEIDEPTWGNHTILGPKSQSFCQWTFMCKPRLPVMMRLIDGIIDWLNEVSRVQDVPVSEIKLNFDEVITGTGPSAFTGAVLAEMKAQTGRDVTWDEFHAIKEPKQIGNILVLTVYAFAAGQGHSDSGDHDNPAAVVRHHYHASLWPDRHPRYSHPAFGMVEECNWNKECVDAWDANTTTYKTLLEEQQAMLIAAKEQADREKFDIEVAENEKNRKEDEERRAAEFRALCDAPPATEGGENNGENNGEGQAEGAGGDAPQEAANPEDAPQAEVKPEEAKPEDAQQGGAADAPKAEEQSAEVIKSESTTTTSSTSSPTTIPTTNLTSETTNKEEEKKEEEKQPKHHPQSQSPVGTSESEAMPGMTRKRDLYEEQR